MDPEELGARVAALEEALTRRRLNMQNRMERPRTRAAARWLRAALADGPVYTAAIQKAADASRVSWRIVKAAPLLLRVVKEKEGFGGKWGWSLPEEDADAQVQRQR